MAVGAVKRSRKSWAWSLVGAGADGAEVVEVDGTPWGKAWTKPKAEMTRMTSLVKLIIVDSWDLERIRDVGSKENRER